MAGISAILRQLRTFVASYDTGRHTDADLLERFVSQRDELAFAALLERHGPMILGVCRRILQDEHRAEDAFQATFLVLCLGSCLRDSGVLCMIAEACDELTDSLTCSPAMSR